MAIAATALSLREHLQRSFAALAVLEPEAFRAMPTVQVVRTDDFGNFGSAAGSLIRFPSLTLFCYRVDVNRTMRSPWSAVGHVDDSAHLPVDIHFLLTPFDSDAEAELRILGAAMQCLDRPRSSPDRGCTRSATGTTATASRSSTRTWSPRT